MPTRVGVDLCGGDDVDDDVNDVALPSCPTGHLVGHEGAVLCVEFNATGAYALTGGKDRTIRLWNPERNLLVKSYAGGHASSSDGVRCLAASSDSSRVASGGGGSVGVGGVGALGGAKGDVAWWDVATGAVVRKWHGHDAAVNAVCLFEAAGGGGGASATTSTSVVLSASCDATARAWDPRSRSGNPIQVFRGARDSITGVGTTAARGRSGSGIGGGIGGGSGGPLIVTSSVDGAMRSYDVRNAEKTVDDVGCPIAAMSLGPPSSPSPLGVPEGKRDPTGSSGCALLSCLDGRLRVIDLLSGERLAELYGHVACLGVRTDCRLFSPPPAPPSTRSSLYAACGSEDGRVCAWSVESEEMVRSVSIHADPSTARSPSTAHSPSTRSPGRSHPPRASGAASLPPPPRAASPSSSSGPVTAMAIRPGDAGVLLAAGTDGRVRVFQRKGTRKS